ncbi:MAG: hypothetical protein V2A73_06465 [Pseudomonadota bacterium]
MSGITSVTVGSNPQVCDYDLETPIPTSEPMCVDTGQDGGERSYSPAAATATAKATATDSFAPAAYCDASLADGLSVGAAALKGHDSRSGIEAELLGGSLTLGPELEGHAQMAFLRATSHDGSAAAQLEVMGAKASLGQENVDGSTGLHAGAQVTAIAVETTVQSSGWSATAGLSLGVGAEGSVGVRDADRDGQSELCMRASLLFFALGACLENPLP